MSLHTTSPEVLEEILKSLTGLQFGTLEIVVHDGRITEIRQTKRRRFEPLKTK